MIKRERKTSDLLLKSATRSFRWLLCSVALSCQTVEPCNTISRHEFFLRNELTFTDVDPCTQPLALLCRNKSGAFLIPHTDTNVQGSTSLREFFH